ncbi:MAG: heavy-metal-associated domain-containing protein [Burkholderiales bacterium]|nr:heavy-metal-associated domain-containing protein [Burkholderiales bacterium]
METFRVDDMTCGHCAGAITQAVRAVDANARVDVNLAEHLVHVEAAQADAESLRDAITRAGYTPVPVQASAQGATPRPGGCCCGSGRASCAA